jgi:nitrous oxidase accessory protein
VRKTVSLIVLLLLFSVVLVSIPQNGLVKAEPETIVVPDNYTSIQEAIDNSNEGDTVFVKKGIYEGPINETLIINKTISLIGEETTVLNLHPLLLNKTVYYSPHFPTHALFYNTSLILESDNVTISGFTIEAPSPGGDIYVIGDGIQISNCIIDTEILWLKGSYSTISETFLNIYDLQVIGSSQTIAQNRFFTMEISSSHNNITRNTLDTIFLYDSYNIISDNSFNQMYLESSNSNIISNNTCSLIWIGRYGHTCSNNIFAGNFLNGGELWGILMADGSENVFYDNYITNYGGSHDGYGVAIGSNHRVAENNTFYHNTFVHNNKNVGYNWDLEGTGNFWDNGIEGNYWDDYNGTDNDGDGIGDTPYIIDENNIDNYPLMEQTIIPEFPSWTTLLITLVTVVTGAVIYRQKMSKSNKRGSNH